MQPSKRLALLAALHIGHLVTEDGSESILDFVPRRSDRLDFASVSRGNLQRMLGVAYDAGYLAGREVGAKNRI